MSAELRKGLNLPMLVALGAAGVIGSSWVYTASAFFRSHGAGGEIFGLALGALLAICIALAYAELVARFPRAGGEIVFVFAAFGRGPAFLAGWLLVGAYVSSLAFYVTASGMLIGELLPGLKTVPLYVVAGTGVYLPVLAFGVGLCVVVWLLTATGMRLAGGVQLLLLVVMVCIGLALASVGFSTGRVENFWPAYAPDADPMTSTIRFVLPAMTFLSGFSLVTALAEDADLPPAQIGLAVVLTVIVAAGFYGTVLLATAWVIPWQTTASLTNGVIDAFRTAGFPALARGAFAISVLGLVTSFLALFPAASRVILALGRAGLLSTKLARLSGSGQPLNALLLTLGLTLGLGWLGTGALLWFLDAAGVFVGLAWCMTVGSLYRVRRTHMATPRFRARPRWLPGVGAVAAFSVIAAILVQGTSLSLLWPYEYAILGIWIALGAIIYAVSPRTAEEAARVAVLGGGTADGFMKQPEEARRS